MLATALLLASFSGTIQAPEQRHPADESATLSKPRLVRVDGEPIDVEVGHAAPLMRDWDGDGTLDLLVGQFGNGRLRIYPNGSKEGDPKLGEHVWAKSEKSKMKVPTG